MLLDFFSDASCFKEIDIQKNDLLKVVHKMEFKSLKAKEVIFNMGDVGDFFYILIYGRV